MNVAKKVTTPTGLTLEFSPILAEKINTPADSLKNGVVTTRHSVQLRQEVKTTYPAVRGNDLFKAEEFGKGPGQSFIEKRVCWLNVPETVKVEDIQKKLNEMDSPKLVRVLSLKPVLSADQVRTIENGRNPKSFEDYLNDFVIDGNGQPALFAGKHKQYRKIQFSKSFVEDEDNRMIDLKEIAPAGAMEIAGSKSTGVPATI